MHPRIHIAHRRARRTKACLLALAWTLASCEDGQGSKQVTCNASLLEADLDPTPFMGPGADEAGTLRLERDREYVVSTTYGVPKSGADGRSVSDEYSEVFEAIQEQLTKSPGLVALQLASSEACGSGRTLAVWRSEDEMYEFVTSPAHLRAMQGANTLLEPGYAVAHYSASDANQMTFEVAVRRAIEER